LEGPGIIYRIHRSSPSDDIIEFYFDGESIPRIRLKITELFDGRHAPFLFPLVGNGVGGHYSYLPLAYQRSCKVVVKAAEFHFYQIKLCPVSQGPRHPHLPESSLHEFLLGVEEVKQLFHLTGSDIRLTFVRRGTKVETETVRQTLRPGQAVTLFESAKPGRIVGLRLRPASAFAGGDRDVGDQDVLGWMPRACRGQPGG